MKNEKTDELSESVGGFEAKKSATSSRAENNCAAIVRDDEALSEKVNKVDFEFETECIEAEDNAREVYNLDTAKSCLLFVCFIVSSEDACCYSLTVILLNFNSYSEIYFGDKVRPYL